MSEVKPMSQNTPTLSQSPNAASLRRVAIVEDEMAYRELFQGYVKRYGEENHIQMQLSLFPDGLDIVEDYQPSFDIILMDIQMPHLDGMRAARLIRRHDSRVAILFITTLAQYAIKGYEVDALDYVLKPVTYEQFALRLAKAVRRTAPSKEACLLLPSQDGQDLVPLSRIRFIEVEHHTLLVHALTQEGSPVLYQLRKPLSQMEKELENTSFARCDQSVLVNLSHVTRVGKDTVELGEDLLPISRSRKKDFLTALADFYP